MTDTIIPVIVIDDTPVKLRGICAFVQETSQLRLHAGIKDMHHAILLIEQLCKAQAQENPTLDGWLILSDLHLGTDNGVRLGRLLLEKATGLRIVIYTQDSSWTLAAEIFRQEYARGSQRGVARRAKKQPGLHGYALFGNMEPSYLERIATTVVRKGETFIDPDVLQYLLKRLRGQQLTPRLEECAAQIAEGLSNDDIALRMGFLNAQGKPNMGPLENMVSELYSFFAIEGAPSDPGRRVLLAHAYEAYAGLRPT
jgi:DNA-binding NarL/FixJ family response regulator